MKKNLFILTIFSMVFFPKIEAQVYQISNGGFENWEGSGDSREPVGFNSFMSADCVLLIGCAQGQNKQVEESSDIRPGSSGHSSCKIWAKSIFGTIANGNLTSGRIRMGSMTATNSSNYNSTVRSNPSFNQPFHGKPDSLVFWAKSNCTGTPRIITTIHDDYDFRDPSGSDPNSGNHVVGVALGIINTNSTWARYSVPFSYGYPASIPHYILICASTNQNPGEGSNNEYVYIDDFEFIYNCEVSDIKLNGVRIDNFNPSTEQYNTTVPCGSALNLQAIPLSVGATVNIEQATIANNFTATITITNGNNSKTIIVNFIPINSTSNITDNICTGQDYVQNGFNLDVFNNPGIFNESINVLNNNCFDVKNLTLSVHPTYEINTDIQICTGQQYDFYGNILTAEGNYQHTLISSKGCDSIINLNLTIGDSYIFNYVASICEGGTYSEHGFNTSENGFHTYSIPTGTGCDSVFNLNLTVHNSYNETINLALCEGLSYNFNGTTISESGTYYTVLQSSMTCDSIVNLVVTTSEIIETEISEEIYRQQRYTKYGFDIFDTDTIGTFTYEIFDTANCELKILNLTIKQFERPPLATSSDFAFTVFPNPAKTYLTVQIENYEANDITYIIYDMQGNIVLKGSIIGDSYDINTSTLLGGVYNLKLILSAEFYKSTKIIIR